jgi:primase-polymerase (primpol)-like protein
MNNIVTPDDYELGKVIVSRDTEWTDNLHKLPGWLRAGRRHVAFHPATKKPYRTMRSGAQSNLSDTWISYEQALELAHNMRWGVGWMITPPYVGIDLDRCVTPGSRRAKPDLLPWALEIIAGLPGSYVELSPSWSGIHIITRGHWGPERNNAVSVQKEKGGIEEKVIKNGKLETKTSKIEVYARGRYFTLTGRNRPYLPYPVSVGEPPECQEGLDWLLDAWMVKSAPQKVDISTVNIGPAPEDA